LAETARASDASRVLVRPPTPLKVRVLQAFLSDRVAVGALGILVAMILIGAFAPFVAPHDPLAQSLGDRLLPPAWDPGGDPKYLFGTDHLGRDILSRVVFGARVSLTLSFIATTVSLFIGVTLGLVSGYSGGWVDALIMRIADTMLALPFYVIGITIVAVLGPSFTNLVLVLTLFGWTFYGRVARGEVLSTKKREYVEAARVIGAGPARIMFRHILPNVVSPLIVIWTLAIATTILSESGLSFLGLGVQPPTPSWGTMISDGQQKISSVPWLAIFPGLALMITVMTVNVVGDALRDALDPKSWRR
jgi:ABC-type dipeptide/oligopeptide/nickel transport system permease subunit